MNTNNGYSYRITITAEELSSSSRLAGGSKDTLSRLQPPKIDAKGTNTRLVDYTISRVHHFAFNKIVEPRFDGIGEHTGQPVNFPDFISEHHFLGLMRATEKMLAPKYEAIINGKGDTPGV